MKDVEHGAVKVIGERLSFEYPTDWLDNWSFDANDVAIIGEYTTSHGPWAPDYFWVFVLKDCQWHLAPVGMDGEEDMRRLMWRKFVGDWKYGLCGSTDFDSRVVCPSEIVGIPIFEFRRPSFWSSRERLNLTQPILEYLRQLG